MSNNISKKTVMVTGASRGIGAAFSRMLLREGASKIFLVARKSDDFESLLLQLKSESKPQQEVIAIFCDLGNQEEVQSFLDNLIKDKQKIDVLINNAGFTAPKTIFEATYQELEQSMSVNLFAPFLMVQKLLQAGNKFSHIINVASTAGIKGRGGWSTYSSSKAALIAMSESLREELLPLGTRVSCISPGRCATNLRRTLAPDEDFSTIMQPENVAESVKFLLSDAGHFIDSENLVVRL